MSCYFFYDFMLTFLDRVLCSVARRRAPKKLDLDLTALSFMHHFCYSSTKKVTQFFEKCKNNQELIESLDCQRVNNITTLKRYFPLTVSETWHLISQGCSESPPPPRHRHSAVLHDNAMWVFGGMTDLQEKSDFWRFDLGNIWRITKPKLRMIFLNGQWVYFENTHTFKYPA